MQTKYALTVYVNDTLTSEEIHTSLSAARIAKEIYEQMILLAPAWYIERSNSEDRSTWISGGMDIKIAIAQTV